MVIKGNVKREKGEAESRKKKVKVNQLPSTISMTCGQLKVWLNLGLDFTGE
jgi:sporulation-control protein spo0M